tara:strand:- start:5809 stop:6006 length:198 start_codon:yes stop_codon:yes gene_type:complete
MKIKKSNLIRMWKSEIKNMAPSPERDEIKHLSFKQWIKKRGSSLVEQFADADYTDDALKLLQNYM